MKFTATQAQDQKYVLGIRIHLPEVESLRVQSLWLLKEALPSREESDISLSIINSKAHLHQLCTCACISPNHGSTLNTCSNDFICRYNEHVTSSKWGNHLRSCCEVTLV